MWSEAFGTADDELPDSPYERALMLRTGLVTRATGGDSSNWAERRMSAFEMAIAKIPNSPDREGRF